MTNTALQVTNFDFYGDSLVALKDNATGEIYTAINHILRNIGFADKDQIRKRRDRWINDPVLSKGIQKFILPTQMVVAKKDTTLFDDKDTYCISQRKLPLALAKINITPKMKLEQPELSAKLELYQDKCADVLASVFIDNKSTEQMNMQPMLDSLRTLTETVNSSLLSINERISSLEKSQAKNASPEKKYSRWKSNTFAKLNTLHSYVIEHSDENLILSEIIHLVIRELEDTYDIELNDYVKMYKSEYELDTNPYALDVINHYRDIRNMFTLTLDAIMENLNIKEPECKTENIFDVLAAQSRNDE